MEVAGDSCVGVDEFAGYAGECLLELIGGGDSLAEANSLFAQFDLRVEEDDLVDQVLAEESSVEVRACFEEDAEDVALGEGVEDCGKREATGVFGDGLDLDVARSQGRRCGRWMPTFR